MKVKTIASLFVVVGLLVSLTGCAVYMAAKQPSKKNLSVLRLGTARSLLLAEIGQPVSSETRDGTPAMHVAWRARSSKRPIFVPGSTYSPGTPPCRSTPGCAPVSYRRRAGPSAWPTRDDAAPMPCWSTSTRPRSGAGERVSKAPERAPSRLTAGTFGFLT